MATRPANTGNYPALVNNGWFPSSIPWAEYITEHGTTQENAHAYEGGNQALFSIIVYFFDYVGGTATTDLLGTNLFNTGTGNLDRQLPMRHPYRQNLYAERIVAARPVCWQQKYHGDISVPFSAYSHCVLTVLFTQPPWQTMLSDALLDSLGGTPRQEWRRFTRIEPASGVEQLARDGGNWQWAETSASGPTVGSNLLAPLGQFQPKDTLRVTWYHVPYAGLFSGGGLGPPTNLYNGVMKVNNATFLGRGAGTLLMLPPRIEVKEAPDFYAVNVGPVGSLPLCCNVTMDFVEFNPPAGAAGPIAAGHQLVPFSDGKYYTVRDAATNTQLIYQTYDYTQLFKLQT